MPQHPLVVAVLHTDADDKQYALYSAAYGLEMQIDNEWEAELVLLAPHEFISAVTEDTDVTGEDTAIVSAGVTDVPLKKSGKPDLKAIRDARNNWLFVAGPGCTDTEGVIQAKLNEALNAGCRVVLGCVEGSPLSARLSGIDHAKFSQVVVACLGEDAGQPASARRAIDAVRESLRSIAGAEEGCRIIVGGRITAQGARELLEIPHLSGFLLQEVECESFDGILKLLAAIG